MISSRVRWLALVTALLALCALLYWPSLRGPFLFDDFPNLAALASIDHVSSWRDLGIYLSYTRSFPGRPLAMLSFLLQQASWPHHPFPFKLVNLGLHLACGVLVYLLVHRVAQAFKPAAEAWRWKLAALLATAAWLLNPIQLSGVVLVVQRMTLLMALFVLLGLLAYLHGLLREDLPPLRRGVWMAVGLWLCMGLAFLSKENGILLPLYALVMDATVLRAFVARLPRRLQWWRQWLIWPIVVFVLAYLCHTGWLGWGQSGARDFTGAERLLTEPRVLWDYINRMLLPRFGGYGLYHDAYVVSRSLLSPWTTLPALLGVLAAAIAGIGLRKRWPLLALAVLWYLGGQLLESTSLMLELYFEHRNYVPSMGLAMAAGIGIAGIANRQRLKIALLASGLWLAACCITTAFSARVYQSENQLAQVWARQQPESSRAQVMLANQLYVFGHADLASGVAAKLLERNPNDLGLAMAKLFYDCMAHRATATQVAALLNNLPHTTYTIVGFQNTKPLRDLAESGHCTVFNVETWKRLVHAMLDNSIYGRNNISAGYLHYQLSEQATAEGDLDTTIAELQKTWQYDPNPEIPRLEAKYLSSAGLYDEAIEILQTVEYSHLPRLRRWLVDDRAINAEAIVEIKKMKAKATTNPSPPQPSP